MAAGTAAGEMCAAGAKNLMDLVFTCTSYPNILTTTYYSTGTTEMIEKDSLKKMISLLEGVLEGSINPDDAVNAWPYHPRQDELAARALHILEHFASDVDIHEKEPAYERDQRDRLSTLLAQLKVQDY